MSKHRVQYALIGGYAVVFHGYVRATNDIDLLIDRSKENAERLCFALDEFGFDDPKLNQDIFNLPNKVIQLGVDPYRIDLLTGVPGINFQDIQARFESFEIEGITIPVISFDDLILAKKATGRARDLADIEELQKLVS